MAATVSPDASGTVFLFKDSPPFVMARPNDDGVLSARTRISWWLESHF
jgi:hypothetical protein